MLAADVLADSWTTKDARDDPGSRASGCVNFSVLRTGPKTFYFLWTANAHTKMFIEDPVFTSVRRISSQLDEAVEFHVTRGGCATSLAAYLVRT